MQEEEVGVAVLWLDAESPSRRLRSSIEEHGWTFVQPAGAAALIDHVGQVRAHTRVILCFGPSVAPTEIKSILDSLEHGAPQAAYLNLVFGGTSDLADYQELVDEDRLFYLCRVALSDREVFGLIEGAAGFLERSDNPAPASDSSRLPVDTLRRLALARDLAELTQIASAAAAQAVGAQRGRCCLFDSRRQAIWSPTEATSGDSPAVGLVSFILRTGLPLCLPRIGDDPRFDRDLDDPEGEPHDRFLGTPVRGTSGEVVAVLLALRSAQESPFEPREIAALEAVAAQIGPYLIAAVAAETASVITQRGPFREQALREREMAATRFEPLRLAPGWTRWTFWLTLSALAAALLAVVFVRVPEYASGVAVIRGGGRTEVTATAGGTVSSLAVAPQSRVRKGQLLATLHSAEEAADLRRLERELELKLAQRLQAPSDPAVAQDLVALRAERDLAAARLSERELRAPADGEVSDIRVARGQSLEAGQPVLSILDGSSPPSLVALLPGRYLSQLHPGMKLRLELPGHPYVYQWLVLDSAAEQVIGPAEARRLLGPVTGDAVSLEGPLAMVTAPLLSSTFEVAGQTYSYRDGMPTQAEVRVRSERLLFALLPALKGIWGHA